MYGKLTKSLLAAQKVDGSLQKVSIATRKVNRRFSASTESWQKLTEGLPAARKVDGKSSGLTESSQKLMKGLPAAQKFDGMSSSSLQSWWKLIESLLVTWNLDGIWRKFYRQHRKLTEADGRTPGCTESWWKLTEVYQLQGILTESRMEGLRNFAEVLLAVLKVDGRPHGHRKNWQKFTRLLEKLTEVDGQPPSHTECWRNLTECLPAAPKVDRSSPVCKKSWRKLTNVFWLQKVDGSWRNFSQPLEKLTEVARRSVGRTEAGQRLTKRLPPVQNVVRIWQKVFQLCGYLMNWWMFTKVLPAEQ